MAFVLVDRMLDHSGEEILGITPERAQAAARAEEVGLAVIFGFDGGDVRVKQPAADSEAIRNGIMLFYIPNLGAQGLPRLKLRQRVPSRQLIGHPFQRLPASRLDIEPQPPIRPSWLNPDDLA